MRRDLMPEEPLPGTTLASESWNERGFDAGGEMPGDSRRVGQLYGSKEGVSRYGGNGKITSACGEE